MEFHPQEIEELKTIAPSLRSADEGGYSYILIEKLSLPENCVPDFADGLLCPMLKEGYQSRLYLSVKPTGCKEGLNWNATVRILDRTWYAISWQTPSGLKLKEMLLVHLKAFKS